MSLPGARKHGRNKQTLIKITTIREATNRAHEIVQNNTLIGVKLPDLSIPKPYPESHLSKFIQWVPVQDEDMLKI